MPTKYATLKERQKISKKIKQMESVESNSYLYNNLPDQKQFKARKETLKKQLDAISPPPITPEERKQLSERKELLEAFEKLPCAEIKKPEMPSTSEMWTSTSQTRGKHKAWEHAVKNYTVDENGKVVRAKDGYGAEFERKDLVRRLDEGEEDIDAEIASTERLRSSKNNMSLIDSPKMDYSFSAKAKENYDEVFPDHEPTEVERKISTVRKKRMCSAQKANGKPCGGFAAGTSEPPLCTYHKQRAKLAEKAEVTVATEQAPTVPPAA